MAWTKFQNFSRKSSLSQPEIYCNRLTHKHLKFTITVQNSPGIDDTFHGHFAHLEVCSNVFRTIHHFQLFLLFIYQKKFHSFDFKFVPRMMFRASLNMFLVVFWNERNLFVIKISTHALTNHALMRFNCTYLWFFVFFFVSKNVPYNSNYLIYLYAAFVAVQIRLKSNI